MAGGKRETIGMSATRSLRRTRLEHLALVPRSEPDNSGRYNMGGRPAKSPVAINLTDSDDDIEIIHHIIVVSDDEAPPEQGPSRSTIQQVCPHTINEA